MNDDYNEGRRLWKRLSGTHDAVGQYSAIGALVRLVREAKPWVFRHGDTHCEEESACSAWLSEARALVGEEDKGGS